MMTYAAARSIEEAALLAILSDYHERILIREFEKASINLTGWMNERQITNDITNK